MNPIKIPYEHEAVVYLQVCDSDKYLVLNRVDDSFVITNIVDKSFVTSEKPLEQKTGYGATEMFQFKLSWSEEWE